MCFGEDDWTPNRGSNFSADRHEGGPNQIIEMLAKELILAYAGACDPAGSPGSRPSIWRTSVRLGLNVGSGLEPDSKAYVANHQ
jgi:hypothetical protein